jgi:hypothetical protein
VHLCMCILVACNRSRCALPWCSICCLLCAATTPMQSCIHACIRIRIRTYVCSL